MEQSTGSHKKQRKALEGVRVVDLTGGISGPFCTMLLGDLGADIIKVEKPPTGDDFRHASPVIDGESYYFMLANRNKRSLGLNLKEDEGRKILRRLIKDADVLVENYRPGTSKSLGLDYGKVRDINPRIVHCSISGFGQTGPYKDRAAFDLIIQAMCGLMDVTGVDSPTVVGTAIADMVSGLYGAYAILGALQARNANGEGQHIDVSMLDSMISMMISATAQYFGRNVPPSIGYRTKIIVPFGVFKASDGSFVLEAASDGTWQRLCQALGRRDMAQDPRFGSIQDRVKNRDELLRGLEAILSQRRVDEWIQILSDASVPCGKILDLMGVFEDKHVTSREIVQEVPHPTLGKVKLVGPAVKFSGTPAEITRHPPLFGQHNQEILSSIGFEQSEIEDLTRKGIVLEESRTKESGKA